MFANVLKKKCNFKMSSKFWKKEEEWIDILENPKTVKINGTIKNLARLLTLPVPRKESTRVSFLSHFVFRSQGNLVVYDLASCLSISSTCSFSFPSFCKAGKSRESIARVHKNLLYSPHHVLATFVTSRSVHYNVEKGCWRKRRRKTRRSFELTSLLG